MKSFHHNSNNYILNSDINITYGELFDMSNKDFGKWIDSFKSEVKKSWVSRVSGSRDKLPALPVGVTRRPRTRPFCRFLV